MSDNETRSLTDKFMLRLPDGMRDRIKAAAEANNRSMNSEILAVLEEKYPQPFADLSGLQIVYHLSRLLEQASPEQRDQLLHDAQTALDEGGHNMKVTFSDGGLHFSVS